MGLPNDIFHQITDTVTLSGPDEPLQGNRKSSRVELRTHVTLLPWNNPADSTSVRIHDLSSDGLGILHSQRMPLDDEFVICFPLKEKTVMALYTIVYWEPLAEKLYAIGARFDRMVDDEELALRREAFTAVPAESTGVFHRIGQTFARRRKAS